MRVFLDGINLRTAGLTAVCSLLLIAASGTAGALAAEVQRVSLTERSDGAGYVLRIHTDGPIEAHSRENVSESAAVITFFRTGLSESVQKDDPAGPISSYSLTGGRETVKLRLEFDSEQTVDLEVYPDGSSDDLLIALRPSSSPPPSVSPSSAAEETEASDEASTTDSGQPEEPYVLSQEERERWKLDCVVIDPGHGGRDPGSHGHGVQEKDIVLKVGLQLGHYIEKHLDLDVVYTRTSDRFVPLHERGRIANEKCGKLFISLHVNAISGPHADDVHGTETYILGLHKSDAAHRVMQRENSVIKMEENPDRYENYGEDGLVVQSLAQNMYVRESEQLAMRVQNQFTDRVHRESRGVKQAGFLVLWRASMPAILVELGFLSHPGEARFLNSEDGQVYLASAIFRAVRAYKAQYEKGLQFAAGDEE